MNAHAARIPVKDHRALRFLTAGSVDDGKSTLIGRLLYDSRAILVRPTARAYKALPKLLEVSNGLLDRAFAGFNAQQIEAIARATEKVRDNLSDPGR